MSSAIKKGSRSTSVQARSKAHEGRSARCTIRYTVKILALPNELLIKIVSLIDITKPQGVRDMKALELTCHRLKEVIRDQQTIATALMVQRVYLAQLFPSVKWTIKLLARLIRCRQGNARLHNAVMSWMPELPLVTVPSHLLQDATTMQNDIVFRASMTCLTLIESTGKNRFIRSLYRNLLWQQVQALMGGSIIYANAFFERWNIGLRDQFDFQGFDYIELRTILERALRKVFLSRGREVAFDFFEHPLEYSGSLTPFDAELPDWIEVDIRPNSDLLSPRKPCLSLRNLIAVEGDSRRRQLTAETKGQQYLQRRYELIMRIYGSCQGDYSIFLNNGVPTVPVEEDANLRAALVECMRAWYSSPQVITLIT